jgi:hypothetical protein
MHEGNDQIDLFIEELEQLGANELSPELSGAIACAGSAFCAATLSTISSTGSSFSTASSFSTTS